MRRWVPQHGPAEPFVAVGVLMDGRWYVEDNLETYRCRAYSEWISARMEAKALLAAHSYGWTEVTAAANPE